MSRRIKNRNLEIVHGAVRELGGKVLRVKSSQKHYGVRIITADGVEFWMRIHQGRVDPFKQRGWIRQAMAHASRLRNHYHTMHRGLSHNDNRHSDKGET